MATISQERLGKWYRTKRAQHVATGVKLGIEQGIEQERARNLAMVRRLAAIKFGDRAAGQLEAALGAAPAAEALERAGVAIMECGDGDELLTRIAAEGPPG